MSKCHLTMWLSDETLTSTNRWLDYPLPVHCILLSMVQYKSFFFFLPCPDVVFCFSDQAVPADFIKEIKLVVSFLNHPSQKWRHPCIGFWTCNIIGLTNTQDLGCIFDIASISFPLTSFCSCIYWISYFQSSLLVDLELVNPPKFEGELRCQWSPPTIRND